MKKKGIHRNMKLKKKSIEQCLPLPFCESSSSRPIYMKMTGPSKLKAWPGALEAHEGKSC